MPWAFLCRLPFFPLFRSSSREMVETDQPIQAAMYVSDLPSFFSVSYFSVAASLTTFVSAAPRTFRAWAGQ